MLKNLFFVLVAAASCLAGLSGVAFAANAVDPADGSLDVAKAIYDAFTGGHAAYAAALALVLAVALVRKYAGGRWPWMHTDAGSAALVLVGSFGTALSAALAGGGALTLGMAESAGAVAFAAAGGYGAIKKLIVEPLAPRLPAWLQKPVLWLFQHASDKSQAPQSPSGNTEPAPARSN